MSGTRHKRWWLLALPAVAIASAISVAQAHGPFGFHHEPAKSAQELSEHVGKRAEHLLDRLDASDAQRAQIQAIVTQSSPEVFALMREGRTLRSELKNALLAPTIDSARVTALETQLHGLTDRVVAVSTRSLLAVSNALTPAQRAKIADKLAFFDE